MQVWKRILSSLLIVAILLPSTLAHAVFPQTVNFRITGFDGAQIEVFHENNEQRMYTNDWMPRSQYINGGTNLTIAWRVDSDVAHTVLINDEVYTGTETKIDLTIPSDESEYEFELVNHAEVDGIIQINESDVLAPTDERPTTFQLTSDISELTGKINLDKSIRGLSYKLSNSENVGQVTKLPAGAEWSIENPAFVSGDNRLDIVVLTDAGKQYKKTFTITKTDGGSGEVLTDTDTDGDGFFDQYEELIGTDPNNPDTDGDGLTDLEEISVYSTSPLLTDTDGNGVSDGDEDLDDDGLSNLQEKEHATDPTNLDTDADGLTDGEEVRIGTDPLRADSDEDGLSDADELKFSLDPLNSDTYHDGILDGNRVFEQTRENNDAKDEYGISASVKLDVKASDAESLTVEKVETDDLFLCTEVPGFIGNAFEFRYDGDIETATLTFDFPEKLLSKPDFVPAIYYWNADEQLLEELPDQMATGNSVSASVTHFSRYILLNKTDFDKVWEREIKALDPDGNVRKATDMIFVLDSSGSMSTNDPTNIRKDASKQLVDKLKDNDQGAVVDFADYGRLLLPLTSDKEALKSTLSSVNIWGGTAMYSGFRTALDQFAEIPGKPTSRSAADELNIPELVNEGIDTQEAPQADGMEESAVMAVSTPETRDAHRFIIILSDGEDNKYFDYTPLVQEAVKKGIKVFTIGLGRRINTPLLQSIATATDGRYYHATVAGDLEGIFDDLADDVVLVDEDNDKLFDYYETTGIRLGSGRTIYTDPKNPDTDGDGLLDGEELELRLSADKKTVIYFKYHSDPTKADSDNDGLLDNAPTIIGGKTITPKDPEPITSEPMAKVWKAEIAQARNNNIQQYYQTGMFDDLDFDTVQDFVDYVLKKYGFDEDDIGLVAKRIINAGIDLALSNRELVTKNRETLTNVVSVVKQALASVTSGEKAAKMSADFGAFVLNFRMDEDSVAYHAKPDTWQREFGYNSLYDEIFEIGSSMNYGKLYFNYNGKLHLVWSWRGDYWNLGAGTEVGVYSFNRKVNDTEHYDAITYNLPMTISLYGMYTSTPEHYFSWSPVEDQWWITGFNYRHQNANANNLVAVNSIDFSAYPTMYAQIKDSYTVKRNNDLIGNRKLLDYSIFDDDNKTAWFMWYG